MKPYGIAKLILLGVCASAISISFNAIAEPRDTFVITVGTSGDGFEDDSGISAGGGDVGGDVVVYINGNPVIDYQSGGVFKQINQYIRNGSNSVRLEGDINKSLYVKVGVMTGPEFKRVAAKKEFKPAGISRGAELSFSTDVDYVLPIFDQPNRIPENASGKTVYPLLEKLEAYFAGSEFEQAAALLLSQTKLWSEQAYGQEKEQLEQMQQQAAEYYRENAFAYRSPSPESVRLIRGESMVLVYSGVDDSGFFKSKTLGEFIANGSKRTPAPAMRMVFIDGRWHVWD